MKKKITGRMSEILMLMIGSGFINVDSISLDSDGNNLFEEKA